MIPKDHQIAGAAEAETIIRTTGMVYFNWEERTGKTLTSILLQERLRAVNVLIVTKKKAIPDWIKTLDSYDPDFDYVITNWHMLKNVTGRFDATIIDEPHGFLSGAPKPGKMQQILKKLVYNCKYITYLSATSNAQGYHQLFHQLDISKHSPFSEHKNYYSFWNKYGIDNTIWLYGKNVEQYNKVKDVVWDIAKSYFITKTRKELGFKQEPKDIIHYIELDTETRKAYNALQKDKIIELRGKDVVCDHISKLRTVLHQLEGGTIKQYELVKNKKGELHEKPVFITLNNTEKVDFILDKFGDTEDLVIMYNYIAEEVKLITHFRKAKILQGTSYAEGVDLSMHKHLVIYSMNFSTSKYTQRRARQANMDREDDIDVHYLLVKKAISDQAYDTVAINKKNYVDSTYIEKDI